MAVVLIKLIPKAATGGGTQAATATGGAIPAAAPSKSVATEVDIPGVVSTVQKENKTISRLLWAGVGSAATMLLMSLFGRNGN